nr:hypothetical protein HUO10_003820 [Paraburkholderia busanensis]
MKTIRRALLAAALSTLLSTLSHVAHAAGMRDETVQVPLRAGLFAVNLTARIYTPPGDGPFPLVVINHGKSPGNAAFQNDESFYGQSLEFVRRGYAVIVPTREGFGTSGGRYVSDNCNVADAARHWANSVEAAIGYARTLPYVDSTHIVVIGQSQGGITTVALGERNLPGVLGIVNIAGGARDDKCSGWQESLVRDYRDFGSRSTVPAIFLYGDNDSYWGNGELSRRFFDAYREGNPNTQYVDEGVAADGNSHMIFHHYAGERIWLPPVGRFFESLGLNWRIRYADPHQGKTVAIDNIDIVPYRDINPGIGAGMEHFLHADPRAGRAIAIAPNGHYGFATGKDAQTKAMNFCAEVNGIGCRLYAIDDQLVDSAMPSPQGDAALKKTATVAAPGQ